MSEPIFLGCTTPAQDARLLETIERAKDPAETLAELLDRGRRLLARDRAEEERSRADKEAAERALGDERFAPLLEAARALLPPAWLFFLDTNREKFESHTDHAMFVALPGLVPIEVGFSVRDWADRARYVGAWELGTEPYRVAIYERYHGEEEDHVIPLARRYWTKAADPLRAMALAEEWEAKRLELAAQVEEANRQRAERQKARAERQEAAKKAPTAGETLLAALSAFVAEETAEAGE